MTEEKNRIMGGTLYLVATPIGNLSDLSQRAIKVLSEVDFIAAEDTRNTRKLLTIYGISKQPLQHLDAILQSSLTSTLFHQHKLNLYFHPLPSLSWLFQTTPS